MSGKKKTMRYVTSSFARVYWVSETKCHVEKYFAKSYTHYALTFSQIAHAHIKIKLVYIYVHNKVFLFPRGPCHSISHSDFRFSIALCAAVNHFCSQLNF